MLLAPNLLASALGVQAKMVIALCKITINCRLSVVFGLVIAIVDDRSRHAAKNRLDHIQELGTGGEWCQFHTRGARDVGHDIIGRDPFR